jgi:glycosyltransferase involved in cell wall biosynthesis
VGGEQRAEVMANHSGVILRLPAWTSNGLRRGVLVSNHIGVLRRKVRNVADSFWIIERVGWCRPSRSRGAHVTLVDDIPAQMRWDRVSSMGRIARDLASWLMTSAAPVRLPISNADFVDTEAFAPDGRPKTHDVIMVARWDSFKRHDLLLDAFGILGARRSGVRGVLVGHGDRSSTLTRLRAWSYHRRIVARIRNEQLPIDLPFAEGMVTSDVHLTKATMASLINGARMGVILSKAEGVNRFKMECMACDVPVIICADACWTLRKHVTPQTGMVVPRRADALADAILAIRDGMAFTPRAHVLASSGCVNSMRMLQQSIDELDMAAGHAPAAISAYDGRNNTLIWAGFADQVREAVSQSIALRPGGG